MRELLHQLHYQTSKIRVGGLNYNGFRRDPTNRILSHTKPLRSQGPALESHGIPYKLE